MSVDKNSQSIMSSQLDDLKTFHKIIVAELNRNCVPTKYKTPPIVPKESKKNQTFGVPLDQCSLSNFSMSNGHTISIPSFLVKAFNIINNNLYVEGLFSISGNIQRQKNLSCRIQTGGNFEAHDHIHDITSLVKRFFRDLPVMILENRELQDTLRKCLKNNTNASKCIRMVLLMLPTLQLNTLIAFLQLLKDVSKFSDKNKMNSYALAIVVTPCLVPVIEDDCFIQIIKILIEEAKKVGIIPQKILARYCLEKKKSRPIKIIFDDNERIDLYFFLNGRFHSPFKYKTCVGDIKTGVLFKTVKECCKKCVVFHHFRIYKLEGRLLRDVQLIYDEAAYILVPFKDKFKCGGYSTALDLFIEKRFIKPSILLPTIDKVILKTKSVQVAKLRKIYEDDSMFKNKKDNIKVKYIQQTDCKQKAKSRFIYVSPKQHNNKEKKGHIQQKRHKHLNSIWKLPAPIEVENLIRQETERGKKKRDLYIQEQKKTYPSLKTKKKLLKHKKQRKESSINEKNFSNRLTLVTNKGAKTYVKRGEKIRNVLVQPLNEVKKLKGIRGLNKGTQLTMPIVNEERTTKCFGKRKSRKTFKELV